LRLNLSFFFQGTEGEAGSERPLLEGSLVPFRVMVIFFLTSVSIQLHVQGKTQEAKADLSRLAKIRAERDAAQAKRKAEAEGLLSQPPM